jgi:hypothetical protein
VLARTAERMLRLPHGNCKARRQTTPNFVIFEVARKTRMFSEPHASSSTAMNLQGEAPPFFISSGTMIILIRRDAI